MSTYNLLKTDAAFDNKPFLLFLSARVSTTLAYQMLSVAVGWQIYALTKSTFYLGLVGLAQFLPMILLTLIVGHVADRYDRRRIVSICQFIEGAGALALAAGSYFGWLNKETILMTVFILGAAKAFEGPAMQALMPGLVSAEHFSRAAAWAASSMQTASIIGPALGGLLYAAGPVTVYTIIGIFFLTASMLVFLIKVRQVVKREPTTLKSLFAGITFIRSKPEVLGAISLDLFAVLLGGATALLPVFAKEILHTGPLGLGILRSAPAIGALLTSVYLAHYPLQRQVGRSMFISVIIFGFATMGFALSTSYLLSIVSLIVLGAADVVSMVIRSTLVQLETPDEMRGRVSAVNSMFIGTSNQFGEFESGLTAAWLGTVPAALIGGIGTIIVAAIWMRLFPQLMRIDKL